MRTVRKCILIIMEKERTATMAPDTRERGLCLESSSGCAQRTAAAGPCRRRRQSCWWRPPSHGVCACVCRDLVARMDAGVRCCRGGVGAAAEERLGPGSSQGSTCTSYTPVTVLYHASSMRMGLGQASQPFSRRHCRRPAKPCGSCCDRGCSSAARCCRRPWWHPPASAQRRYRPMASPRRRRHASWRSTTMPVGPVSAARAGHPCSSSSTVLSQAWARCRRSQLC